MIKIILSIIVLGFQVAVAGKIISPCNSLPKFVLKGELLDIKYNRSDAVSVDSIVLSGSFKRIWLPVEDSLVRDVVWDSLTQASYNVEFIARIPAGTPSDLYSLLVFTSSGCDTSHRTVRIVSSFARTYSFIHITDPHIGREWGNGYALELQYTSRLVNLINILGVEFVVNTGDLVMEYSNDNGFGLAGSVDNLWSNFYNGGGGYDGFRKMNVPHFLLPGNHDYRSNYAKPVGWNVYCGYRFYGFSYGDSRFVAFDGELGTDYPDYQLAKSNEWLDINGSGVFRALLIHNRTKRNTAFCDSNKVHLALMGHTHANAVYANGTTPTRELVTASAGHFGYVGVANVGWFRYITVSDSQLVSYPALQYGNTVSQDDSLTLEYTNENNGKVTGNKAIFRNKFHVQFNSCKARFVMTKGTYAVDGGTIEQVIENDTVSVYDVRVDIPAASIVEVAISDVSTTAGKYRGLGSSNTKFNVTPNPLHSFAELRLLNIPEAAINQRAKIDIVDINGRIVKTHVVNSSDLLSGINLDIRTIKGGVYLFKVSSEKLAVTRKALLVH